MPINTTINLKLAPYSYSFQIIRQTNTKFQLNANLFTGDNNSTSITSTVSLTHSDYENLDFDSDISSLLFTYTKSSFTINGSWDVQTYNNLNHATVEQLNSTIYITANNNSQKIGDLRFKAIGSDNELFVFYKDGTSENSSSYNTSFMDDFKSIFNPFLGDFYFKKSVRKSVIDWKIKNLKRKFIALFE